MSSHCFVAAAQLVLMILSAEDTKGRDTEASPTLKLTWNGEKDVLKLEGAWKSSLAVYDRVVLQLPNDLADSCEKRSDGQIYPEEANKNHSVICQTNGMTVKVTDPPNGNYVLQVLNGNNAAPLETYCTWKRPSGSDASSLRGSATLYIGLAVGFVYIEVVNLLDL